MAPNFVTHQVERKLNKTTPVRISGKRGLFRKSTLTVGLKRRFRHQNPQLGHAGLDSTRDMIIHTRTNVFEERF